MSGNKEGQQSSRQIKNDDGGYHQKNKYKQREN